MIREHQSAIILLLCVAIGLASVESTRTARAAPPEPTPEQATDIMLERIKHTTAYPDDRRVLVAFASGGAIIVDTETSKVLARGDFDGPNDSIALSRDGKTVVVGNLRGPIFLDGDTLKPPAPKLAPSGFSTIESPGWGKDYDLALLSPHGTWARCCPVAPARYEDQTKTRVVDMIEVATRKVVGSFEFTNPADIRVAFSNDEDWMLVRDISKKVRLFTTDPLEEKATIPGIDSGLFSLSKDGALATLATAKGRFLWDLKTNTQVMKLRDDTPCEFPDFTRTWGSIDFNGFWIADMKTQEKFDVVKFAKPFPFSSLVMPTLVFHPGGALSAIACWGDPIRVAIRKMTPDDLQKALADALAERKKMEAMLNPTGKPSNKPKQTPKGTPKKPAKPKKN
jgi:hypothetical protein